VYSRAKISVKMLEEMPLYCAWMPCRWVTNKPLKNKNKKRDFIIVRYSRQNFIPFAEHTKL